MTPPPAAGGPPRFPPGAAVRVKPMPRGVSAVRRLLVGQVGTVVMHTAAGVLVDFPAAKRRDMLQPHYLEPADPPPARAVISKRK